MGLLNDYEEKANDLILGTTPESEQNDNQNSESKPSLSKKIKPSDFQILWKNDWPWLIQNEKEECCAFTA